MAKKRDLEAEFEDLRTFLLAHKKERLVDLLVEHAYSDESLARRLQLERRAIAIEALLELRRGQRPASDTEVTAARHEGRP